MGGSKLECSVDLPVQGGDLGAGVGGLCTGEHAVGIRD